MDKNGFVEKVRQDLLANVKHSKISLEKLAAAYGIEHKNLVKEFTELAIVLVARQLAHSPALPDPRSRFDAIVDLYYKQANLSHRTSESIMLQQYSTPAPIGYLAGLYIGASGPGQYFEPSAGNGLLTIAGKPGHFVVNEIDRVRRQNLESQGFMQVLSQDATQSFWEVLGLNPVFDGIVTNPPFGSMEVAKTYKGGYPIKALEHHMALNAMELLKPAGKAAIIIGGHNTWDERGRIQAGKNRLFMNYLYATYNVEDVINIDGHKLYSRQGTAFNTRLILINGKKAVQEGAAPLKSARDKVADTFEELYDRVTTHLNLNSLFQQQTSMPLVINDSDMNFIELEAEALRLELELLNMDGLGMPYVPTSAACVKLDTQVPDSMGYETHEALRLVKEAVGSDIDLFVMDRLGYKSKLELCKALAAEQIDAVALAIYNVEARGQGMIIGDQAGIGKGRQAAAMIRYGVHQGIKPVFLTIQPNLFSDLYRDLKAIGSAHLKPLIINAREDKSNVKDVDQDGKVVYQAPGAKDLERILAGDTIPAGYDFAMGTYSQFSSEGRSPLKPGFLRKIAKDSILVLDESHKSSGSSNTGMLMQDVVASARGVLFLSATFAKRPDNLPVYAMKTAMSEANISNEDLVAAISTGGVALQEILSSQLVQEGQMIRRERSMDGVEVNWVVLDELKQEHQAIADICTDIIRDIIYFQKAYIENKVSEMDKEVAAAGAEVETRKGTKGAGVDNTPYFSKIFNVINQMLFSIKVRAVADRSIMRLKEGKKVVVAFSSTMGSFVEQTGAEHGDTINADFSEVLRNGLSSVMKITVTHGNGKKSYKNIPLSDISPEGQAFYRAIEQKIEIGVAGISISPIDVLAQRIRQAGFSVAEITGRKYELQVNEKTMEGLVLSRKKENVSDAFRKFNDNEIDVLLINQSGSTGASAHAIPTEKVPADQVKQRWMIVLQPELDINTEIQKRGRTNRTGQIMKPGYDYMSSAIPAERRLMMMLQKKLKSLDANTSSNQKQSEATINIADDFLNKIGDQLMDEYLQENPDIERLLDNPLNRDEEGKADDIEGAAQKVSGRVAVLSTAMQQAFYDDISSRYLDRVEYLKQIGEYDLEMEEMPLEAETLSSKVVVSGKGGASAFGQDTLLEKCMVNALRKPFSKADLDNLINESLAGRTAEAVSNELFQECKDFVLRKFTEEQHAITSKAQIEADKEYRHKRWDKLKASDFVAFEEAVSARQAEIMQEAEHKIEKIKLAADHKFSYLVGLFRFFQIGRGIKLVGNGLTFNAPVGVFLGFQIDRKKSNPFAPSNIKLRFAIASSLKYVVIPASMEKEIQAIKGASMDNYQLRSVVSDWAQHIQKTSSDRVIRYIVTGNILQGIAQFRGKLINYTLKGSGVKKGILMPDSWELKSENVDVPISMALTSIRSMLSGRSIATNIDLGIIKQHGYYSILTPTGGRGKHLYLDADLREQVENGLFEKVGDKMRAYLPEENLEAFVDVLDRKFKASVSINESDFEKVRTTLPERPKTNAFKELPAITSPEPDEDILLMEMEAEALELELQLLAV